MNMMIFLDFTFFLTVLCIDAKLLTVHAEPTKLPFPGLSVEHLGVRLDKNKHRKYNHPRVSQALLPGAAHMAPYLAGLPQLNCTSSPRSKLGRLVSKTM